MNQVQRQSLVKVRAYIAEDKNVETDITGPHHFSGRLAHRGPYMAVNTDEGRQWRIYEDGYISWVT